MVSFEILTKWKNLKATLINAEPGVVLYHDFRTFSMSEIHQQIGLYFSHGLAPSPQIEKMFRP